MAKKDATDWRDWQLRAANIAIDAGEVAAHLPLKEGDETNWDARDWLFECKNDLPRVIDVLLAPYAVRRNTDEVLLVDAIQAVLATFQSRVDEYRHRIPTERRDYTTARLVNPR